MIGKLFLIVLVSTTAFAGPHHYKFQCESARQVQGKAEVKMSGEAWTREPLPGEFICNEAVTAPKEQHFDIVYTTNILLDYLHADGSGYTSFSLKHSSDFGACDANPLPNSTQEELQTGGFGAILQDVDCSQSGVCGRFGVIDSSRLEQQINQVSWGVSYTQDASGHIQGATGGVGLIFQDSKGQEEPFQWDFGMPHCNLSEN